MKMFTINNQDTTIHTNKQTIMINSKPTMLITITMDTPNKVVTLNKEVMLKQPIPNKVVTLNKEVILNKAIPTPKEITQDKIMDNKHKAVTQVTVNNKHMVDNHTDNNMADNHTEGKIMVNNNKYTKINNTTNTLNLK